MKSQQQTGQPVGRQEFPPPPEYARLYTQENLRNGTYFPPPPVPTRFTVFGEDVDLEAPILGSLADIGIQQFYSQSGNWKSEVKKLNRSILAALLDLLQILINAPESPDRVEKIETIRLLFINIHHLVNEFRPIQARDSLRVMVERQNREIHMCNVNLEERLAVCEDKMRKFYALTRDLVIDEAGPCVQRT